MVKESAKKSQELPSETPREASEQKPKDHEADVFFSFPPNINMNLIEESLNKEEWEYELVCKNYSKMGTYLLRDGSTKW